MVRDSKRLDALARANYRRGGLQVPAPMDDENVLGDKITNTYDFSGSLMWATILTTLLGSGYLWFSEGNESTNPLIPIPAVDTDTQHELRIRRSNPN